MGQDSLTVSAPAMEEIIAAISSGPSDTCAELYDSGTTCHVSPYHEMFQNFTSTPPKLLNTANKGKFIAIGKGDMVIQVPNGMWPSNCNSLRFYFHPRSDTLLC